MAYGGQIQPRREASSYPEGTAVHWQDSHLRPPRKEGDGLGVPPTFPGSCEGSWK